jgi:hypothetical protein
MNRSSVGPASWLLCAIVLAVVASVAIGTGGAQAQGQGTPRPANEAGTVHVYDQRLGTLRDARVTVELFAGRSSLGSYDILRSTDGTFHIPSSLMELPATSSLTVSAEAQGYFAANAHAVVARGKIVPSYVHLRLARYSPELLVLLLVPGLLGLVMAVSYLTNAGRNRAASAYPVTIALIWAAVTAAMTYRYVTAGDFQIPLLWPDTFVSSGVVTFSFLGSLVFTAYVLQERSRAFEHMTALRQRKFYFRIGSRILVAPYVAVVAYMLLAATFDAMREGPLALFISFFAGLSIKPILHFLNQVGMRVLSNEHIETVAGRVTRATTTAPPPPTADQRLLPPASTAFFDAIEQARAQLLSKPEVIGVSAGTKRVGLDDTGRPALVVYVRNKRDDLQGEERVPEVVSGFPTDVREFPAPDPTVPCRAEALDVSWSKVHDLHRADEPDSVRPQAPSLDKVGRVVLAVGSAPFMTFGGGRHELDVVAAYQMVSAKLGDAFDFVSFVLDPKSLNVNVGNYSVQVFNDTAGINHPNGSAFNQRAKFGSQRLRAVHVFSAASRTAPLSRYLCLHEFAHSWAAYATFRRATDTTEQFDLLRVSESNLTSEQGRFHWSSKFDDGASCMDYDQRRYISNGSGFVQGDIADFDYTYCPLDLYLMGLARPNEVKELRLMEPAGDGFFRQAGTASIEDVVRQCGPHSAPWLGTKREFTQAFVVLAGDLEAGRDVATAVDAFLPRYETAFATATQQRATVRIS